MTRGRPADKPPIRRASYWPRSPPRSSRQAALPTPSPPFRASTAANWCASRPDTSLRRTAAAAASRAAPRRGERSLSSEHTLGAPFAETAILAAADGSEAVGWPSYGVPLAHRPFSPRKRSGVFAQVHGPVGVPKILSLFSAERKRSTCCRRRRCGGKCGPASGGATDGRTGRENGWLSHAHPLRPAIPRSTLTVPCPCRWRGASGPNQQTRYTAARSSRPERWAQRHAFFF